MLSYLYRTGTAFYLSWLDRAHSAIGSHRVNVGGHGVVAGLPAGLQESEAEQPLALERLAHHHAVAVLEDEERDDRVGEEDEAREREERHLAREVAQDLVDVEGRRAHRAESTGRPWASVVR